MATTFKGIALDIANNHGNTDFLQFRCIEFLLNGSVVSMTNFSSGQTSSEDLQYFNCRPCFKTPHFKTGLSTENEWRSEQFQVTNQRIYANAPMGITFDSIRINNSHHGGAHTNRGAKDVKITISSDPIDSSTYNAPISNGTVIFNGTFPQHTASDEADDQGITLSNMPEDPPVPGGGDSMPYANLVGLVCGDAKEVFKRFRDFLCRRNGSYDYSSTGIGWTYLDSSYAVDEDTITQGDWFVASSYGVSGKDRLYIKFEYRDGTYWYNSMYLYWDISTSTGYNRIFNHSTTIRVNYSASYFRLWVYGDLDRFVFAHQEVVGDPNQRYGFTFGKESIPYPYIPEAIGVCTTSPTSGSDKVLALDIDPTSYWEVGDSLYLWSSGTSNSNFEKVTIKSMTSSSVTVDLAKSHAARLHVSKHHGIITSQNANMGGGRYTLMYPKNGAGPALSYINCIYNSGALTPAKPDGFEDMYGAVPEHYGTSQSTYMGMIAKAKDRYRVDASYTDDSVYEDALTGDNYRVLRLYSGCYLMIKEV